MRFIIILLVYTAGIIAKAETIDFSSIQGAKRLSPADSYWELGWMPPNWKSGKSIYPVNGLQGVVFKQLGGKEYKGNQEFTLKDIGVPQVKLPLLGIKGDFYITVDRTLDCPVRVYDNAEDIACEERANGIYAYCYLPDKRSQKRWFACKNKIKVRKVLLAPFIKRFKPITILLDSRRLAPNSKNYWTADPLLKTRNYKLPVKIKYIMFLPASYFETAVKREWRKGASVSFIYRQDGKDKEASFLLDPAYMPNKGMMKIGFAGGRPGRFRGVYVVQSPGKGKDGIIIGRIKLGKNENNLALKPDSIKINPAVWKPYDRVNIDKRKHIGYEGAPEYSDFAAFETRDSRDWGYLISYIKRGNKFAGKAYPRHNVYTKLIAKLAERQKKDALNIAYKYQMRIAFDINEDLTPDNYIPEKFKGETLDPASGKFIKAKFLDWANPDAAAWEMKNIENRLKPYKGVPRYVMIHEGTGRHESENMSLAALKSFRNFCGKADAKFPVPPSFPETSRTTNNTDEELIRQYVKWKMGFYRGHIFMNSIFKAAGKALKGGHFLGGCYFGSVSDGGAYFVPYIAASPDVVLLCPENVRSSKQGIFQIWRKAAQENSPRLKLMPHSYPMLITANTDTFIKWFEDIGLLPEVQGLILGGGGLEPKTLFEALAAKHFGKSRMTPEEADKIINTLKKNGIFYLDGYGKKQIKKGSYRNRKGKNIFDLKNARKLICSKETIKVDGDLKDWKNAKWEEVKGKEHLLAKKDWKGNWDLSFSFASCYDNKNLYLAFKVLDDKRVLRTQTLALEGDEVQLFIGFVNDPSRENISIGFNGFTFRLIPDKRFQQIYTGQKFLEPVTGSVSRSRVNSKAYIIEASLPWENFKYKAKSGKLLPVEIHVLDADKMAANVEKSILWNAFEGKKKPWSVKGTTQWGLFQL